jgi:hypothetical protein
MNRTVTPAAMFDEIAELTPAELRADLASFGVTESRIADPSTRATNNTRADVIMARLRSDVIMAPLRYPADS